MANSLDQRNKSKCRGSRKGPKLRLWIWCFVIQCFLSLPCIFSKCLGVDITVAVYPEGNINVEYGNPLEIFCIAENYSSSDIEFTLAGVVMDSEVVNSTTRRLYIERPEKQSKTYYCKNNKTGKICVNRVLVDTPPDNVKDFECVSKNLDILNCSWVCPQTYSNVNYSLTFSINGNIVGPPCKVKTVENTLTKYCFWNTSSLPRYRQHEEEQFLHLNSCNTFGCNFQNFTIDHYAIVKPDPPIDLKIVKNGTHSVGLKWQIPNNMVDFLSCGVEHIIEYQIAKIDNTTYFHQVDASQLPPKNKTYRFNLTNLPYAHVQYEVRVYIKSKKAVKRELWSNFSYIVFYTASERPRRPPDTIAGAFDQSKFTKRRVICVYWKQLEEYEEAGANFTYKVITTQGNTTQVLFPDKNKSLSYVILNATLDALNVNIWSYNMNGSSVNSSHIYIPQEKQTNSLKLSSFTKLAYENGTYELSWGGIKYIDNYTLFWCQHNTTAICAGRIDFAVIDPKKTKHVINLPNQYRYQFAISANKGPRTSGMVWAKCDISKDGFVMYGYPLHLNYDAPGKSHVTLRWAMDCNLQDGIITGYNISYCPIVQTSSYCDESVENKFIFIPDPKQFDVTINNLLPFRTYQLTFALNTIYGQKNIENATAVITTSEDTPTSPTNVFISNIKNDSLVISWDPPQQRNGIIGKYVIYKDKQEYYVERVSGTDISRKQVTLTGLQGFTNYSFAVQACNIPIDLCSKISHNDTIFIRTRIGPPSKLKAPTIKNSPDKLMWETPDFPGGAVDLYQIRRIRDDMEPEIFNTTELSYKLIHCEGSISSETYQVRALNFDEDAYHGLLFENNVNLDSTMTNNLRSKINMNECPGEWSEPSTVACKSSNGITIILVVVCAFAIGGLTYGSLKCYKRYRKMEDIKPVLPNGLGIPEKDISKYTFGGWNPNNKEEKPSSDEMLLLPNKMSTTTSTDIKQKDVSADSTDQTDSTALSDSTNGSIDRQVSTSDDGSESSLHLDNEPMKNDTIKHEETSAVNDPEISFNDAEISFNDAENSFNDAEISFKESEISFENSSYPGKRNTATDVIRPVNKPKTGYMSHQSQIISVPASAPSQPASSSYVMAAIPSPSRSPVPHKSGYVLRDDYQAEQMLDFENSLSQVYDPDTLPPTEKIGTDSSYMQLQSLNSLPSLKPNTRNTVPLKSVASGCVSPHPCPLPCSPSTDEVINKHLNNMMTAGQLTDESAILDTTMPPDAYCQLTEESAILDPTMSPDAYCRFSWSTDPANDNLHTLLGESPSKTSKN